MNYLKAGLLRGMLGIGIGVFINATILFAIALVVGHQEFPQYVENFPTQYGLSCLVGFTFGSLSVVWEVDEWSLTKQTVIHFIIATAVYFPAAVKAKWLQLELVPILVFVGIFLLIYVGIWLGNYYYWKNKVADINNHLKD